ncbi:MAG: alpha/beta hydrolase [Candidatus Aureabacteria bacterium]|nr:alpha/beta hydrolase [Candidatus Auribacterota bacterium]
MDKNTLQRWLIGDFSLKRMLTFILFTYCFLLVLGLFFSDQLMFPSPPCSYITLEGGVKIKTEDGHSLYAVHLPNPEARWDLLFFHGNGEDLGDVFPLLDIYRQNGFSVFAVDYRGYGKSTGKPSEKALNNDLKAIHDYLVQNAIVKEDRLVVLGRSIGSGPAVEYAVRYGKAALIIESGFTSAFRVLTQIRILPFDKFENIKKIRKIGCPLLLIHGTKDEVIPFRHGRQLFKAAQEPKSHYWVEGARHNDLQWVAGETYWETLKKFVDSIGK